MIEDFSEKLEELSKQPENFLTTTIELSNILK